MEKGPYIKSRARLSPSVNKVHNDEFLEPLKSMKTNLGIKTYKSSIESEFNKRLDSPASRIKPKYGLAEPLIVSRLKGDGDASVPD